MAKLVVDSSVWVAAFLPRDSHHAQAAQFVSDLQAGAHHFHSPYLVMVETCASVARHVQAGRMAYVTRVRQSFEGWTQRGMISWYDLDQQRADNTITLDLELQIPLAGADSVVASLSDELEYTVKTFDNEILNRYFRATI